MRPEDDPLQGMRNAFHDAPGDWDDGRPHNEDIANQAYLDWAAGEVAIQELTGSNSVTRFLMLRAQGEGAIAFKGCLVFVIRR